MPETQVVGRIPDFTPDTPLAEGEATEVKEALAEEAGPAEETVTPPAPPADKNPPSEVAGGQDGGSTTGPDDLSKAVTGLQDERAKLLKEISDLRGQKREIKREELIKVQDKIDELADLNPTDVTLIDRVLRAKGYVTKDEAHGMFYEAVKQEELTKFLEKYPEYKPENDVNDVNWSTLQRELGYYRMPDDPHAIADVLDRAHRGIASLSRTSIDRVSPVKARQAQLASVGAGGTQRSSSRKPLDARKRMMLELGGWSSEEIANIEKKLE